MKIAALALAALAPNEGADLFSKLLDCMESHVVEYARVTDDFSVALDAAWGRCEIISKRWSLFLWTKTPKDVLDGLSVTDIHQANKEYFYKDVRGELAADFLEARPIK